MSAKSEKRLTPTKAVRKLCMECMCGNAAYVRECPTAHCLWYTYRLGRGGRVKLSEIKKWCLHCNGVQFKADTHDLDLDLAVRQGILAEAKQAVKECNGRNLDGSVCPLVEYRLGKNPERSGITNKARPGRTQEGRFQPVSHDDSGLEMPIGDGLNT